MAGGGGIQNILKMKNSRKKEQNSRKKETKLGKKEQNSRKGTNPSKKEQIPVKRNTTPDKRNRALYTQGGGMPTALTPANLWSMSYPQSYV